MKKVWKGNKTTLIVLIVVIAVLGALALGGISYAIWTRVSDDSQDLTVPLDPYNPSEKYIVYRGVDAAGNLLGDDASDEDIKAYAVVGYGVDEHGDAGLVAEVVIPSSHNDKPVVRICNSNMGTDLKYRLNGNPFITSIQIPETVTEISNEACAGMALLKKVEILGEETLTIGSYAFANCPYLDTFECAREIVGENYLVGSNLFNS